MVKARIGRRLKEIIMGNESSNKKTDLELLAGEFNQMKLRIRQLIEALQAQHELFLRINEARLQVALKVSALAEGSAISNEAGPISLQDIRPDKCDLSSYVAIHSSINDEKKTYADRYLKHIVGYAIEWETVIIEQVAGSLKQAKGLRRDVDHYQSKVESMTLITNRVLAKGLVVNTKLITRSVRNEEKYQQSRKEYDVFADNLCTILKEVTTKGWQSLHPILLKLVEYDISVGSDESKLLSNLTQVAESLKSIANDNGLQSRSGLKILEQVTPVQSKSSNAGQVEFEDSSRDIQLPYEQKESYGKKDMISGDYRATVGNLPIATLIK